MDDQNRDQGQLIDELDRLRRRVAELEAMEVEHKVIQEALHVSEIKYRNLFNNAQAGLFRTRISDGKVLDCNEMFARVTGFDSREECMAAGVSSQHYANSADRERIVNELRENGYVSNVEVEVTRRDGERFWVSYSAYIYPKSDCIEGALVDITERKRTEEKLRRSEERFRGLVESASDVTVVLGSQGNVIYISPNFEKVWGLKAEGVMGQDMFKNIHPDDIPAIGKTFADIIKNPEAPMHMQIRALYPDGTWHTLDAEARNHLEDPAIGGIVVSFHDVTELKQAKEELKKVNEWYEEIVGLSKTNIDVIDGEFNLRYVDPEWRKIYGDPAGRKCYEYFRGQKEACRDCAIPDAFRTRQTIVTEHVLPRENNRIVEVHTIPFQSSDGEWLVSELNVDITQRKKADEALRESEEKYSMLVESATDGVSIIQEQFLKFVNKRMSEISGYTVEELTGMSTFDLVPPDFTPVLEERFRLRAEGKEVPEIFETRMLCKDGTVKEMESSTKLIQYEGRPAVIAITRDVTERRRMEEALRESEEKNRALIENIRDAIFIIKDAKIKYANEGFANITGYSVDELIGKGIDKLVAPEDLAMVSDRYVRRMKGEQVPSEYEFKLVKKDGVTRVDVIMDVGVITYEGGPAAMGIGKDITERKRMEDALRESEEKYSTFVEQAMDGVHITQDKVLKFVNKRMSEMSGYTVEELTGMSTFDLVPPDFIPELKERFALREHGAEVSETFHTKMLCKDGTVKEMENSTKLIQYEGRPATLSITRDITERKRMEEALRESEQKLRSLFENSLDVIMIIDRNGKILFINRTVPEMTMEDALGVCCYDYISPESRSSYTETVERVFRTGSPDRIETRGLGPENRISWYESRFVALGSDKEGQTLMVIATDITERKRAEEALRESEQKYRLLAENASDVIMLMDMNAKPIYFSPSVTRLLGYSVEEALAGTMEGRMTSDSMEKAAKHFLAGLEREKRHPESGSGQTLELDMIHKNGSIATVEMMVSFIRDASGNPTSIMAIMRDITGRKKAEAEMIALSHAFSATLDPVVILDMDGNVRNVNEAARKLFERDDIGVSALESVADEDKDKVVAVLQDLITNGRPVLTQFNIVTRSGRKVLLEASGSVMTDANGKAVGIVVVERDLTERRQAEGRQKLAAEILGILNEPLALPDAINRILTAIKRETGFYAVGIRLKKDDDFPYFVQDGFSDDFLLTENTLVVRDNHGDVCRDEDGNISLECTCGLVLSGKTDPSNPLFTPGGSAWTSDSRPLLDIPLEQDPRLHTRNRCIHAGFQSVALMPIRTGEEIVGLLQLNDRRKGCFTLEMIRFFEGIAASIGVALMRKQAEDALRESEEKYRILVNNANEAIGVVQGGVWTFANPKLLAVTGYTSEELLGMSFFDLVHPDERQMAIDLQIKRMKGEEVPTNYQLRFIDKAGNMGWAEMSVNVIEWQGKPATLALMLNITERKRAEEALRESERRIRSLAENSPDVILIMNSQGKILFINRATTRSIEETIGTCTYDYLAPEYRQAYIEAADRVFQTGSPVKIETRGLGPGMRMVWYEVRFVPLQLEGGDKTLMMIATDITERKRMDEVLKASEIKYRELFEHTLLGMEVIDAETGKIVLANHSMARMFEFKSPEDMVGIDAIKEHVMPEDMDWALDQFAQSMADPDRKEVAVIRAKTVNGRLIWVTGSATSFEYEGRPAALLSLIDMTAAKEAEEMLIRINKAVEGSSDAIGMSDPQGHHFYHNKAFTELFEYTPEELEAAGGGPAVFANKHVARKVFDTIMGGGSWSGEVEMVSKSGRTFTVLERADAIKDDSGKVIGLVGVHTDITERKKAEEKLRETRDYMENLIEHANVPMVVWTPDFRITRFNRAFERLTGMKAKSVIGKDLEILFPKGTRDRSMSFIRTAMRGARWEVVEIPIANLDGDVRTVLWNISPIYAEDGKTPMAIIAQGQDITERKKAEEALRESEELSRSMLESAAMGIYLLQNKRFIYVNPTFEKIIGYSSEELLGQEAINYAHPDDRDMVRTKAVENIQGVSAQPYEFRALRKDGRQIWVMERVTPVRYKGKRAVLASFMETTEHKKAEMELERAYEDLKTMHENMVQSQKLRAMGEMASGIAHDFNNMLAVILGRTQLVIDDVKDDKVKKGIQIIEQAALDAAKTVKRLQDFARIRVEHPFEPLDVNEVVEGVLKMVESRRVELEQTKGIAIKVEQGLAKVGKVSGDAAELREALLNILFNALDAMPSGGKLTVASEQDEEWVQITIRDTGIGIPDKVKSKVFQPFFTTKSSKGSGLGLSVTYGIIARHGGMIKFDSEVGKGTTFHIRLPLSVEEVRKQAKKSKTVAVKPASILTVDDEPEVLKALGLTLEYFGHWVKDFTKGAEAIKAFKDGKYDIVITDLGMPEVSGWDVARAIKQMNPKVPVLLITGWVIDLDEEQKKLVDGVIAKPFSRESIASAISKVFPSKKKRVVKKKSGGKKKK